MGSLGKAQKLLEEKNFDSAIQYITKIIKQQS